MAAQHLLVFRLSSLGDVAMTVPVIRLLVQQYPELKITVVSAAFVEPLFKDIERVRFHPAQLKGKHKGLPGLYRLYRELVAASRFDGIADLHNVLRTKVLGQFFKLSGAPIARIDKGRKEKKELTQPHNKNLRPLKSTFQRYADVFASLGYPVNLVANEGLMQPFPQEEMLSLKSQGFQMVGLAPFAAYHEKTYPPAKMKEVLRLLANHDRIKVFLFGAAADDKVFAQWEAEFKNARSMAGKQPFEQELQLISQLDLMISMDSANMHLASLYGIPVVSVWGGTHPYLGFYGWGQKLDNAVQVDLECRPSSVFGNRPCPRGDFACMNLISPLHVYDTVIRQLNETL